MFCSIRVTNGYPRLHFDESNCPDEATALRALNASGVATRVIQLAGEAAVRETHAKAIAPVRQADGNYRLGASFRCC